MPIPPPHKNPRPKKNFNQLENAPLAGPNPLLPPPLKYLGMSHNSEFALFQTGRFEPGRHVLCCDTLGSNSTCSLRLCVGVHSTCSEALFLYKHARGPLLSRQALDQLLQFATGSLGSPVSSKLRVSATCFSSQNQPHPSCHVLLSPLRNHDALLVMLLAGKLRASQRKESTSA